MGGGTRGTGLAGRGTGVRVNLSACLLLAIDVVGPGSGRELTNFLRGEGFECPERSGYNALRELEGEGLVASSVSSSVGGEANRGGGAHSKSGSGAVSGRGGAARPVVYELTGAGRAEAGRIREVMGKLVG